MESCLAPNIHSPQIRRATFRKAQSQRISPGESRRLWLILRTSARALRRSSREIQSAGHETGVVNSWRLAGSVSLQKSNMSFVVRLFQVIAANLSSCTLFAPINPTVTPLLLMAVVALPLRRRSRIRLTNGIIIPTHQAQASLRLSAVANW